MLYCPKKPKKPKFGDLGLLQGLEVSKICFFLDFLGQCGIFACFALKRLVFFGTVQRFCSPRPRKCCTVPKKPIFLRQKMQKCCTVPKKPKKPKLGDLGLLRPGGLQTLFCFGFFGTVQRFCSFVPKTLVQCSLLSEASKPKPPNPTMAPERKKCGHMGGGVPYIYIYIYIYIYLYVHITASLPPSGWAGTG